MNHYDAVLGAPDEHERKVALDSLVEHVRSEQREADAQIAEGAYQFIPAKLNLIIARAIRTGDK